MSRPLLDALINALISRHPLPWHIEYDWTVEVLDARDDIVIKLMTDAPAKELIEHAQRIQAENEEGARQVKALFAEHGIDLDD